MKIEVGKYPQLQALCWNRPNNAVVDGQEAFDLYERNWRFVDADAFDDDEQELLDTLTARYGNGILLAA